MEPPPLNAGQRVNFSFGFRHNGSLYRVLVFGRITEYHTERYVVVYKQG